MQSSSAIQLSSHDTIAEEHQSKRQKMVSGYVLIACSIGHVDVVNVLLVHDANVNHQTNVSGLFHTLSSTIL